MEKALAPKTRTLLATKARLYIGGVELEVGNVNIGPEEILHVPVNVIDVAQVFEEMERDIEAEERDAKTMERALLPKESLQVEDLSVSFKSVTFQDIPIVFKK